MDNLLQKVFVFLTKPESELSIVFLVIFFMCFVYGVLHAFFCYRKIKDFSNNAIVEYEKVKEKYTPNVYINNFNRLMKTKEIKFEDLPNIFVSIGILGTFLGLGVAIQGAATLLNTDKVDLSQLNSVLSVIAFKFQTSVWGTCFSLVFQKLISENYYVKKSSAIRAITETLYENEISYRTTLEHQLAELRDMQENFNQYVGNSALFISHTQDFGNRVQLLKENLNSFNQQLISCLNENQIALANHQGKLQQLNCDALKQGFDKIEAINQRNNEFHDAMEFEIADKLETWQKVFLRSENDYAKETQVALRKMLCETLDKAHADYSASVRKMGEAIEKLDSVLNGLDNQIAKIHTEILEEHSKYAKINKDTYKKVGNSIITTETSYQNKIDKAYNEIKDLCKNIKESLLGAQDNYKQTLEDIKQTLEQLDKKSSIMQTKVEKEEKAFRKELLKKLDDAQESNGKIPEKLDSAVDRINSVSTELKKITASIKTNDKSLEICQILNDIKREQASFQNNLLNEKIVANAMLTQQKEMPLKNTDDSPQINTSKKSKSNNAKKEKEKPADTMPFFMNFLRPKQ